MEFSQRIRQYDRDRFIASLFLPPPKREAVFALLAWNLEVARIRETVTEQMVGFIRLQWWREAMEALQQGEVRQHEVLEALAPLAEEGKFKPAHVEALLQAREQDFSEEPPKDMAALQTYLHGTSTALFHMILDVVEEERPADASLNHLGLAWGGLGVLRGLAHHGKHRVLLLPGITPGASKKAVQSACDEVLRMVEESLQALDADHLPRALKPYAILSGRWHKRMQKEQAFESFIDVRAGVGDMLALYLQMR